MAVTVRHEDGEDIKYWECTSMKPECFEASLSDSMLVEGQENL